MPQASDKQRELMSSWFGDFMDQGPYNFLIAHGYTCDRDGMWSKPTSSHNPSIYEVECLKFLRDEWDYDWHGPLFQPDLT